MKISDSKIDQLLAASLLGIGAVAFHTSLRIIHKTIEIAGRTFSQFNQLSSKEIASNVVKCVLGCLACVQVYFIALYLLAKGAEILYSAPSNLSFKRVLLSNFLSDCLS